MILGSGEINYNGHLPFRTSLNLYLPFEQFFPYKKEIYLSQSQILDEGNKPTNPFTNPLR